MQPNNHIAVFASGTGTTLQALIDNQQQYGYCVSLVVTNRECQAQERAQAAGIPTLLSKDWCEIDKALTEHQIQLIVLAGYLAIIPEWICTKWAQRIINIHPSLLPRHGGKGMYGIRVQESVLAAGDTVAGCTVHYVSAEVDGGNCIAQATIDVLPNDTPETLSQRVQEQEKQLLPRTIKTILYNSTQH
jgi:phosphoribosylglycinamide formyltransferase-1